MSQVSNVALRDHALIGLGGTRKWLSPKWFYDRRGSELFERITGLPEYYPTRTEAAILREHAVTLAAVVPPSGALVALGSGASVKTRTLLNAGKHFGAYVPVDISEGFLLATAADLRARYPRLDVLAVIGDFTEPVVLPAAIRGVAKVGFFPGSTIGNLEPEAAVNLLARARRWEAVEGFILGADLVKDPDELVSAYDDAQGVTSEFNLNVLKKLNTEAQANFDLGNFRHEARWCEDPARIEEHLVVMRKQEVSLGGATIQFAAGESIHTDSCRKYTEGTLAELASAAGRRVQQTFADGEARYAVAVLRPD